MKTQCAYLGVEDRAKLRERLLVEGKTRDLEQEWARYKYSVLEHSQTIYNDIRSLLKDKSKTPFVEFYGYVDQALRIPPDAGTAINAYQHVAGYFKTFWDTNQKAEFGILVEEFRAQKRTSEEIKAYLEKEALRYNVLYLLDSYFFSIQ